jgi:hypothetical protein
VTGKAKCNKKNLATLEASATFKGGTLDASCITDGEKNSTEKSAMCHPPEEILS